MFPYQQQTHMCYSHQLQKGELNLKLEYLKVLKTKLEII